MLGDGAMAGVCYVFPQCASVHPGTDTVSSGWITGRPAANWNSATMFLRN